MLVIDKPAGIPVHPGPGGGPNLEAGSTRCASACRGRRRSRIGSTATPAAAWCSAGIRRRCGGSARCLRRAGREALLGGRRGHARRGGRAGSTRPAKLARGTGWRMVVDPAGQPAVTDYRVLGAARRPGLARIAAAHRPDASDPRALRRARLPGRRRPGLRRAGQGAAAAARPRDCVAALPGAAADRGDGAGAAAYARGARRLGYDPSSPTAPEAIPA